MRPDDRSARLDLGHNRLRRRIGCDADRSGRRLTANSAGSRASSNTGCGRAASFRHAASSAVLSCDTWGNRSLTSASIAAQVGPLFSIADASCARPTAPTATATSKTIKNAIFVGRNVSPAYGDASKTASTPRAKASSTGPAEVTNVALARASGQPCAIATDVRTQSNIGTSLSA